MTKRFPVWFKQQYFLKNGQVNALGWIEALVHGTSNHAPMYNFNDEEISNPIRLDASGRCQLKLSDLISYDFVVYDKDMGIDDTIENVIITIGDGGGEVTNDHTELINRELSNQHPISAITNLSYNLADKISKTDINAQQIVSDINIVKNGENCVISFTESGGAASINANSNSGSFAYQQANSFGAIQKVGFSSESGSSCAESSSTSTRVRTEYDTATKGMLIEVDENGSAKIELTANGHTATLVENNLLFDGISIFDLFVLK